MQSFSKCTVLVTLAILASVAHVRASDAPSDAQLAPKAPAPSRTQWVQTDQTKDGITLYKREIPGSDVVAFRGEGTVDAPLALVASIIYDCSRGTEWIEDLKESRALRVENPLTFIEYDHVGTPFIMKDRDFVTRVTTQPDVEHHSLIIEYKSVDDPSAPKTSYVRGEMTHATFILTAQGQGKDQKTLVVADIHCDPKGAIPKWVVNLFQKDWPISTFRNLRKQATKTDIKLDSRFSNLTF
jgi:hypothetical protein